MLNDVVRLIPTPGHTIDHYSVQVGKAGQDAVVTGDMCHSPLQARYPELGMFADYNSTQSGRDAAGLVRPALRQPHADVHGAFSVAVHRARASAGETGSRSDKSRHHWSLPNVKNLA